MGKEQDGSYDMVDGGETVGNSLGSSGGKERYGSEDRVDGKGKPWEMAWGELRWEGAIRECRDGGRRGNRWELAWGELRWEGTDGSNDYVDGQERAPVGRSDTGVSRGWTEGRNRGK